MYIITKHDDYSNIDSICHFKTEREFFDYRNKVLNDIIPLDEAIKEYKKHDTNKTKLKNIINIYNNPNISGWCYEEFTYNLTKVDKQIMFVVIETNSESEFDLDIYFFETEQEIIDYRNKMLCGDITLNEAENELENQPKHILSLKWNHCSPEYEIKNRMIELQNIINVYNSCISGWCEEDVFITYYNVYKIVDNDNKLIEIK